MDLHEPDEKLSLVLQDLEAGERVEAYGAGLATDRRFVVNPACYHGSNTEDILVANRVEGWTRFIELDEGVLSAELEGVLPRPSVKSGPKDTGPGSLVVLDDGDNEGKALSMELVWVSVQ